MKYATTVEEYEALVRFLSARQEALGGPGSPDDRSLSVAIIATALLVLGDLHDDPHAILDAARTFITNMHSQKLLDDDNIVLPHITVRRS